MQQIKQVEVRMDESHLEAKVDAPESMCSMVCDKIMKNMVLTLTVLGKYSGHCHGAFTYSLLILVSATLGWGWVGGYSGPSMHLKRETGIIAPTEGLTNTLTPADN